jgi:hypothetical protein
MADHPIALIDTAKLQLKLFAEPGAHGEPEAFIPVFHRWIKEHVLAELMIDVANYAHVSKGPGVVLIGHTGDYFVDEAEGRFGLLYSRKRGPAGVSLGARLGDLFRRTVHAAVLLGKEPAFAGKLRFSPRELLFRINDRLAAPATDATFAAVRPELESVVRRLSDGPFELTRVGDAKSLFGVKIVLGAAGKGNDDGTGSLPAWLGRLGGPPLADLS